jgi:hypothetical protein
LIEDIDAGHLQDESNNTKSYHCQTGISQQIFFIIKKIRNEIFCHETPRICGINEVCQWIAFWEEMMSEENSKDDADRYEIISSHNYDLIQVPSVRLSLL